MKNHETQLDMPEYTYGVYESNWRKERDISNLNFQVRVMVAILFIGIIITALAQIL